MSLSIFSKQEDGYILLKATGRYNRKEVQDLSNSIHAQLADNECKNLLVDISEMSGKIPNIDRFLLGEYVAKFRESGYRIALVYRAEGINKFFETVAVNRAIKIIVVPDIQAGLTWLIGNNFNQSDGSKPE